MSRIWCGACSECVHSTAPAPAASISGTGPRAIAVYRAIAESIYVRSTGRVVAVAVASLDSTCTETRCAALAERWGMDALWWARGDSTEARDAWADLLARAASPPCC